MDILQVKNLVKTYGNDDNIIRAVDDVSFNVKKGEFVVIVGSSGSGKSTLLHLIGGVDKPTGGEVIIDNTSIYDLSREKLAIFRRRQVGLIYQFYNLIPILDVVENICLPSELDNRSIDNLEEVISLLGLSKRVNHLPNELSGGEQQRVSIGRAIINKPSIILADEPTGNLDKKNGEEIISLLKLYNKKFGQTIIMITHDLELAKAGSRIITISDGKIVSDEAVYESVK